MSDASPSTPCGGCGGCGGDAASGGGRRRFLYKVGLGLMGAGSVAAAAPIIAAAMGPAITEYPEQWVDLGDVSQFPAGETRYATFMNPWTAPTDGLTSKTGCWVRHVAGSSSAATAPVAGDFQVFAVNCAHLGCPVRWFPQSRLFMCPCHGGVYYEDGSRAKRPPPRGLFPYPVKVEGGHLWIDAGRLPGLEEAP